MRITVISDTHGLHEDLNLEQGDMLIHAGDIEARIEYDFDRFLRWFSKQPFEYKVLVGGNHDFYLEREYYRAREECFLQDVCYLNHNAAQINGLRIFGSPYTPRFGRWAFMKDRGLDISEYWKAMPDDMDILITHGPPIGILDKVSMAYGGHNVGCWDLRERVKTIKPKYHIFGHIHSQYGTEEIDGTKYINCSVVNEEYALTNAPIKIDI